MPRLARLDTPGVLHHVMGRGIERRKIFYKDKDREDFVGRLAELAEKGAWSVYAWVLMPNHYHLNRANRFQIRPAPGRTPVREPKAGGGLGSWGNRPGCGAGTRVFQSRCGPLPGGDNFLHQPGGGKGPISLE
jgi:hypothetical protein